MSNSALKYYKPGMNHTDLGSDQNDFSLQAWLAEEVDVDVDVALLD